MCFKIKSGPRGIRTLDLLNAIETRSQLRYGPGLIVFSAALRAPNPPEGGCVRYGPVITVVAWPAPVVLSIRCLPAHDGPGGIRTLDLFSAIEARSQLRYRPDDRSKLQGKKILPEWGVNVKLRSKSMCAWVSTLPGQKSATPACRVPCKNEMRGECQAEAWA